MSLELINPDMAQAIEKMALLLCNAARGDGWVDPGEAGSAVAAFNAQAEKLVGLPHSKQASGCLRDYGYLQAHQVDRVAMLLDGFFGTETRLTDVINQKIRRIEELENERSGNQ